MSSDELIARILGDGTLFVRLSRFAKLADIGKTKGPILRGLAARAPYFHNGSGTTLETVVEFYDQRFNVGFTPQEKKDLIAFLNTL